MANNRDSIRQGLKDALEILGDKAPLLPLAIDDPKIVDRIGKYLAAIKTKPFILLAGISGTGKSRIVRELARACWNVSKEEEKEEYKAQRPRNFEMIQVRPNWHDSSDLIGYVSRISGEPIYVAGDFLKFVVQAWQEPNKPYFLCLDEMNLAPVEQYFAEYLSVIESRKWDKDIQKVITDPIVKKEVEDERDNNNNLVPKKWYKKLIDELLVKCPNENKFELYNQFIENGITLPQNLVVIGTVNMDETTYAFSRKVLDRAMTIEMNEVDLKGGLTDEEYQTIPINNPQSIIPSAVEGKDIYSQNKEVCDVVINNLQLINDQLEDTPFKIAYRTRNEFLLYVVNACKMGVSEAQAFDEIVCMKILPRIEGDQKKVGKVLDNLQSTLKKIFSIADESESDNTTNDGASTDGTEITTTSFVSQSLKKLTEMKRRLNEQFYCSFWN